MSVYIPVALQGRVRQRFGNCCAYCRTAEQLTVAIFEFEHIVPRSVGGETAFENLCLARPTCNRYIAIEQEHTAVAELLRLHMRKENDIR